MENCSSNHPKHGRIGWRGLFWSMICLFAASGAAYAAGYETTQYILLFMAIVIICIFGVVFSLPYNAEPGAVPSSFKRSIKSMPIGYKFVVGILSLVALGVLIGFDSFLLWVLVALGLISAGLSLYNMHKRDKENNPVKYQDPFAL